MTIQVGDRLPDVPLTIATGEGPKPTTSAEFFRGKRVALGHGSWQTTLLLLALEKAGLGWEDITPVDVYGDAAERFLKTAAAVRRLPPMLIVHGREDPRVSFHNAIELQSLCEKLRSPVQTLILPGERHTLSPGAALVTVRQAMRFFDAHLKCGAVML